MKQRAMTIAGLAPVVLLGCALHEGIIPAGAARAEPAPITRSIAATPASRPFVVQPTNRVAIPVPPPPPRPAAPPAVLVSNIERMHSDFGGRVGIAIRSIDDGWTVSANGDQPMPQQSVSKMWVAMTILDQRDRGRIDLSDSVTITRQDLTLFHQPIASLVVRNGSHTTTVENLLRRAITSSDNTANDRLLTLAGGPSAVNEFIRRKSLGSIKFGPGERLLQAGTAGLTWNQSYSVGRNFYTARAALPMEVRRRAFNAYVANPPDGASAHAMVDALARLKEGNLLSAASTTWLVSTMQNTRTGRSRVKAGTPSGWLWGHKTGTGQDLPPRTAGFNDVGIMTAPDGKSYAVAVLIGETSRSVPQRQDLMQRVAATVAANHRPDRMAAGGTRSGQTQTGM
ncbi:serine hydrolase [Sphingomonas sp. AX6]|uniref:serine hydrolase n=1 Tax=Sphingomonas sp. AX6 TaxID=2653171 RepID=UPI001F321561|nr:serine hydrolase [Sphingomonas sp. AX6]